MTNYKSLSKDFMEMFASRFDVRGQTVPTGLKNEKGKLCAINLLPMNGDFKISEPSFKKGKKKRRKKNPKISKSARGA